MNPMEARRAELYEHLDGIVQDVVRQHGLPIDVAEHVACAVVDGLAEEFGGQTLSFAKNAAFKLSQRELAILDLHRKGKTLAWLSRTYNIGERGLRKLLNRAELRNPDLNQPGLF